MRSWILCGSFKFPLLKFHKVSSRLKAAQYAFLATQLGGCASADLRLRFLLDPLFTRKATGSDTAWKIGFFRGIYRWYFSERKGLHSNLIKFSTSVICVLTALLSKSWLMFIAFKKLLEYLGINERYMEMLQIHFFKFLQSFIAFKRGSAYLFRDSVRGCCISSPIHSQKRIDKPTNTDISTSPSPLPQ